jgi:hypothetical protein
MRVNNAVKQRKSKNLAPLVTFGTSSRVVWPVIQIFPLITPRPSSLPIF